MSNKINDNRVAFLKELCRVTEATIPDAVVLMVQYQAGLGVHTTAEECNSIIRNNWGNTTYEGTPVRLNIHKVLIDMQAVYDRGISLEARVTAKKAEAILEEVLLDVESGKAHKLHAVKGMREYLSTYAQHITIQEAKDLLDKYYSKSKWRDKDVCMDIAAIMAELIRMAHDIPVDNSHVLGDELIQIAIVCAYLSDKQKQSVVDSILDFYSVFKHIPPVGIGLSCKGKEAGKPIFVTVREIRYEAYEEGKRRTIFFTFV